MSIPRLDTGHSTENRQGAARRLRFSDSSEAEATSAEAESTSDLSKFLRILNSFGMNINRDETRGKTPIQFRKIMLPKLRKLSVENLTFLSQQTFYVGLVSEALIFVQSKPIQKVFTLLTESSHLEAIVLAKVHGVIVEVLARIERFPPALLESFLEKFNVQFPPFQASALLYHTCVRLCEKGNEDLAETITNAIPQRMAKLASFRLLDTNKAHFFQGLHNTRNELTSITDDEKHDQAILDLCYWCKACNEYQLLPSLLQDIRNPTTREKKTFENMIEMAGSFDYSHQLFESVKGVLLTYGMELDEFPPIIKTFKQEEKYYKNLAHLIFTLILNKKIFEIEPPTVLLAARDAMLKRTTGPQEMELIMARAEYKQMIEQKREVGASLIRDFRALNLPKEFKHIFDWLKFWNQTDDIDKSLKFLVETKGERLAFAKALKLEIAFGEPHLKMILDYGFERFEKLDDLNDYLYKFALIVPADIAGEYLLQAAKKYFRNKDDIADSIRDNIKDPLYAVIGTLNLCPEDKRDLVMRRFDQVATEYYNKALQIEDRADKNKKLAHLCKACLYAGRYFSIPAAFKAIDDEALRTKVQTFGESFFKEQEMSQENLEVFMYDLYIKEL